ncbi:hypothetical protein BS47DRAFT_1341343, partial [Hydnum rufescens UP504]
MLLRSVHRTGVRPPDTAGGQIPTGSDPEVFLAVIETFPNSIISIVFGSKHGGPLSISPERIKATIHQHRDVSRSPANTSIRVWSKCIRGRACANPAHESASEGSNQLNCTLAWTLPDRPFLKDTGIGAFPTTPNAGPNVGDGQTDRPAVAVSETDMTKWVHERYARVQCQKDSAQLFYRRRQIVPAFA